LINLPNSNFYLNTCATLGFPGGPPHITSLPLCLTYIIAARTKLKQFQANHKNLCQTHLERLAETIVLHQAPGLQHSSLATEFKPRTSKTVSLLIHRERTRRMHCKIGHLLRGTSPLGLNRVDVPEINTPSSASLGNPNDPKTWKGPWVTITQPTDIAQTICKINATQYNQAFHTTPFGSGSLATALGRKGDTATALILLKAVSPPSLSAGLHPETTRLLQTLATPIPIEKEAKVLITADNFTQTYRLAKEATSSSPSHCHISHYKAGINDPSLTQLHSSMMSLAFKHGFAPPRWTRFVYIILQKEPGNA
jgi:hypothetical protein